MKKSLLLIAAAIVLACCTIESKAQLVDGSTAQDFTFTDVNGVSQNLYTYLNAGKVVVIDISATWCGPCWNYHNTNALENFYNQYGPAGTNQAMVIWIEGDPATNDPCMTNAVGCTGGTQGNWVAGTPFPMCNPPTAQINPFNTNYQIGYFPTCYMICPDKKTTKVDQYTLAQLTTTMNAKCPPPTAGLDASISTIVSPSGVACGSTFAPVVTLKNFGSTALTACTINYKVDNNPNQTYSWSGNLTTGQTATITLPSVTTTAGTHTFTCSSSNPNAGTDANTANDQSTTSFNASLTATALPVTEGIESATFPPTGWSLVNPDNVTTWARTTVAKKTGSASMFMDNANYTANGEVDELKSSPLNLTSVSNPSLTFQVAYQLYTDPATSPNFSDTLKVQISTDCGVTWTTIYNKFSTALTTATPSFSTVTFVPSATQWRLETVSLTAYATANSALIKFRHTTDYENQLYVDDINISGAALSTNDFDLSSYITVFPNPSAGDVFVRISAIDLGDVNVKILNILGEEIAGATKNSASARNISFDLSAQPNGMYFVEVQSGNSKMIKKVVLNK